MFPANSGFLVNAQTGEHVKSVPVPHYLPEPTLEMIVNAVTGAPKSITRRILVPDVEHYLAERTVCQVSPSKIQRKRLLFPAPKFAKVAAPAKSRKKARQAVALVQRARCAEPCCYPHCRLRSLPGSDARVGVQPWRGRGQLGGSLRGWALLAGHVAPRGRAERGRRARGSPLPAPPGGHRRPVHLVPVRRGGRGESGAGHGEAGKKVSKEL